MKSKLIRAITGLLLALVGHFAIWKLAPSIASGFDLFLVLTLAAAIRGGQLEGMLTGMVAGVIADAVSGSPFGLQGFALTMTGYGVGFAADRVAEMTEVSAAFLSSSGALAQRVLVIGLLYLFASGSTLDAWWVIPMVIGTTTFLVWMIRVAGHLGVLVGVWKRRRRGRKLRL